MIRAVVRAVRSGRLAPSGRRRLALALGAAALTAGAAVDVEVRVDEPAGVSRAGWPVTSGVPFGPGAVTDPAALELADAAGRLVPLQTDVLARWSDGSVRWLLVDFQTDLSAMDRRVYSLRSATGRRVETPGEPALRCATGTNGRVTIETGPLRIELDGGAFDPFGAVWLDADGDGRFADDERVTVPGAGLFVRDDAGRRHEAVRAPADVAIEEAGPLRACVRVTGTHGGDDGGFFRYVVRLHAFRGQPFVKCCHTFINDRQDAVMTRVQDIGVGVRLAPSAGPPLAVRLGGAPEDGGGRLFQTDETRYRVDGREAGARAPGWAAAAGRRAGFAAGVREFWQQWPKAIEARGGDVTLELCPAFPAGTYDGRPLREESQLYYALRDGRHTFKVGVAKTHEIWARFFAGPPETAALGEFFRAAEEPLLAVSTPARAAATGAAGEFPPADPARFFGYDGWFDRATEGHLRRRDAAREYGLLNFGDWYGEREVNWGNLEYDLQRAMLVQFLRTGERRYFLRGAQAARHHVDVDVVHAVNPLLRNPFGAPPRVGDVWLHGVGHTGGYYTNALLPVDTTYQMGHSANYGHVWADGDLLYYHLTGDRRAREVALQVADMMASAMVAKVGTHIRTLGWPMILVLAAYEATGDPKYLDAAERNWRALRDSLDPRRGWVARLASDHCLHPAGSSRQERDQKYRDQRCEGNVPFMEGLTLCALARYHRIRDDPEVLRAITVGIDQMIRECWQEDVKTFRYTACPLSNRAPYELFMLAAEAMAYESRLTGNAEHRRILREGIRAAIEHASASGFGKTLAQMTLFAPHALAELE